MLTFQAVYRKGVLKPQQKLNLPENAVVQLQVMSPIPANSDKAVTTFDSLAGIWGHVSVDEVEQMEKQLLAARQKTQQKLQSLARIAGVL